MKRSSKDDSLGSSKIFLDSRQNLKLSNVLRHKLTLLRGSKYSAKSVIMPKNKLSHEHSPPRSFHFPSLRLYLVFVNTGKLKTIDYY